MTSPAQYDPKITPAVSLGGQLWPIPILAVRQLRAIRSQLIEMNRRIGTASAGGAFLSLGNDDYDALIVEPVYYALTRAHPEMTRDEFLSLEISDREMTAAWLIVRDQSGVFVAAQRGRDPDDAGEAAAAETTSPTGT